jgi:hypothetical protein
MPFVALLIGAILIVAAFNNTHGQLETALESDIPGFFKWAAAIAAILALGFVPGLRTPTRWLLALVIAVIFLRNYQAILDGFTGFASSPGTASGDGPAEPTSGYVANPKTTAPPTATEIAGGGGGGGSSATMVAGAGGSTVAPNPYDPGALLSSFSRSIGFGGMA